MPPHTAAGIRRAIGFLPALVAMNLRATFAQRGAFFVQAGFMLLNNVCFFATWWIFFERFEEIRGWRIADMAALYGVVTAAFGLSAVLVGGVRHLAAQIASGELDAFLTLPADPLLHLAGSRALASGWGDLASAPVFLVGLASLAPADLPWVVVGVLCGAAVFTATGILIHSAAFWLGEVDSVARQLWDFTLTFSLYPRTVFSGAMSVVLYTVIPAAFVGHLPIELLREPSAAGLLAVVGGAVGYTTLAWTVFRLGLRRYASGSRFVARA